MHPQSIQSNARQAGLSLIEMLIVLSILGIVLGFALPAMGQFGERQRVVAAHNQLLASFSQARMQAIVARAPTVVCPSVDGRQCAAGGVWEAGWISFIDRNRNGTLDAIDTLLQHENIGVDGLRVRSSVGRPALNFLADGRSPGSNLTLKLCGEDLRPLGAIIVNNTGRARHAEAAELAAMSSCG